MSVDRTRFPPGRGGVPGTHPENVIVSHSWDGWCWTAYARCPRCTCVGFAQHPRVYPAELADIVTEASARRAIGFLANCPCASNAKERA